MAQQTTHRSGSIESVRASNAGTYIFPLSSEEPYRRYDGVEILSHEESAVDLSFLNSGNAPLLDSHDRYSLRTQIGVVTRAWLQDKRVYVEVKFSNRANAQEIKKDVDDGIIRNVSVGYNVTKTERDEDSDEYLVTKWRPYEASFVPIPADTTVGMGRSVTMEGIVMSDKITSSVRDDSNAPTPPGFRTEEERAEAMTNAINEITTLAEEHARADLADTFIRAAITRGEEPSIAVFRGIMRANLPEDKPLRNEDIGMTDRETRRFSFARFVLATGPNARAEDVEAAAFEMEAVRATGAPRAMNATHSMPTDLLRSWNDFEADGMQVRLPMGVGGGAGGTALQANPNIQTVDHLASRFIDNLRNTLILGQMGVTMLPGLTSNIEIPGGDVNAQAFWLGSEDEDVQETTPTYRKIELAIKTVGNYTDMSRNFLLQSTIEAEAYCRAQILRAVAEAIDLAGWYGTGASGQPTGLANTAGIGSVTFAGAVPTRDELILMDTEIADTNQTQTPRFASTPRMIGSLRGTKIDAGSGQFLMSNAETLEIGNPMARTKQITEGDVFAGVFQDMLMGMWGSLEFGRSTEAKFLSGGIRIRALTSVDFGVQRVGSFVLGNDGV